jgi:hypothetical protein
MEPFMELSAPRTAGDNDKIGPIRRGLGFIVCGGVVLGVANPR